MFKGLKARPRRSTRQTGDVEVLFDRGVFHYMVQELSENLSVEEGGKYVGYLLKAGDPLMGRLGSRARQAIVIVDFLPSGPNAVRTAVELMPDGPYQENLFRKIEQRDSAIEHVGTWHSHHCNGLRTLSDGDVKGYLRTVNNLAYRPDFLVASLVMEVPHSPEARGWIDHFLFVRGDQGHRKITDVVRVVDLRSPFGTLTGHSHRTAETVPDMAPNVPLASQHEGHAPLWFESQEGRSVLARDKRFFDASFHSVLATRRDSRVTITGRMGSHTLAVTFPRDATDQTVSMVVRVDDSVELRLECDILHRDLAYRAAFAVLPAS